MINSNPIHQQFPPSCLLHTMTNLYWFQNTMVTDQEVCSDTVYLSPPKKNQPLVAAIAPVQTNGCVATSCHNIPKSVTSDPGLQSPFKLAVIFKELWPPSQIYEHPCLQATDPFSRISCWVLLLRRTRCPASLTLPLSHLVSDAADLEAYLLEQSRPLALGEVDRLILLPFLHPAGLHSRQLSVPTSGWLHQFAVLVLQPEWQSSSHIHLHTPYWLSRKQTNEKWQKQTMTRDGLFIDWKKNQKKEVIMIWKFMLNTRWYGFFLCAEVLASNNDLTGAMRRKHQ